MRYQVDEKGFYGDFGGAYIPEMLYPNIEELRKVISKLVRMENSKKSLNLYSRNMLGDQHRYILLSVYQTNTTQKFISKERIYVIQVHIRLTILLDKFFWPNAG